MRELLARLSIDELISVLFAVAMRLALRGLLTIVDVTVILDIAVDTEDNLDQAA